MPVLEEEFPALYQAENCEPAPPFEEETMDSLAFELWHAAAAAEETPEEAWVGAEKKMRLEASHI